MGLFTKKQKHRTYVSEEAEDPPDPDYSRRRDPYLVLGDDIPRPPLAGKGLEPNTQYQISRQDEGDGYGKGDPVLSAPGLQSCRMHIIPHALQHPCRVQAQLARPAASMTTMWRPKPIYSSDGHGCAAASRSAHHPCMPRAGAKPQQHDKQPEGAAQRSTQKAQPGSAAGQQRKPSVASRGALWGKHAPLFSQQRLLHVDTACATNSFKQSSLDICTCVCMRAGAVPGPVQPVIPDRPGHVVHALRLLQGALVVYVAFLALFLKWLHPRPLPMAACMLVGLALGMGYSFLHHANKARKERLAALVRSLLLAPFLHDLPASQHPHISTT